MSPEGLVPGCDAGVPVGLTSMPSPVPGVPLGGLVSDSPGPAPGVPLGDLDPSCLTDDAYTQVLSGLPIHDVTPAGIATGLVEAYLQEPGALGSLSRPHLRRSTGKERRGRSRDLLPIPLPAHIRAAVLSRDDVIADATTRSNSRSNRKRRSLGIALWSFFVICFLSLN